jgi:sugar phosphate permease
MATTATDQTRQPAAEASLRWGSWLMGIAAVGFIGYGVLFLVRNSTDSFLELGIGPFNTLGHLGLIYLATLSFVAGALLALRGILTKQHR